VPGLGATGGSRFQLSVGWRQARATHSYNGFYVNRNISENWMPYERMSILDVSARYIVNSRVSVSVTMPFVDNNFSMLFPPNGAGQGLRSGVNAIGIGDISLFAQSYLLKPVDHPFGNVALGLGMKIPTGDWNVQGTLPNLTGTGFMQRAIYPPAIMPGDGGTGIIFGINGFKQFRKGFLRGQTAFGAATYLSNPRDTNGTNSIVSSLGVPLAPQFLNQLTNSVTDSFNVQIGWSMKIPGTWDKPNLKGLRGRLTLNWEGIPAHDLFGKSDGYRQPGYIMSVAPGFTYTKGHKMFIAEVPIVFNRYINGRKSAIPDLNQNADGSLSAAPFNPMTNLGMVPSVAVSLRCVQSF
jgi:hypothetical protein